MSAATKGLLLALLGYVVVGVAVFGRAFPADRLFVPMHTERLEPWRSESSPERTAELSDGEFAAASDKLISFRADDAVTIDALRDGRVPLWNPTNAGGVPHLGQALYGVFYPLHVLYRWMAPERAYVWIAFVHHLLAALFTFLWLRRIGVHGFGAFVGGLAFAFSTYLLVRAHYYQYVESFGWLPCGLLLVESVTSGRRPLVPGVLLALVTGTVLLAGWPQTAVYTIWAWALLAVWRCAALELRTTWTKPAGAALLALAGGTALCLPLSDAGDLLVRAFAPWVAVALAFALCGGKAGFLRRIAWPAGAIVAGGLLAMVQYLPAAEWAAWAGRAAYGAPEKLAENGLRPAFLLDLLVPGLFGSPTFSHQGELYHLTRLFALDAPDLGLAEHLGNIVENTLHVGLLAVPLGVIGLVVGGARRGFAGALAFVAGAFALGWSFVVYPLFFGGWFVGLDPRRALGVLAFGLCALSGVGAGELATGRGRGLARGLAAALGLLAAAALVAATTLGDAALLGPFLAHAADLARAYGEALAVPPDAEAAAAALVRSTLLRFGWTGLLTAGALVLLASRARSALRYAPAALVLAADLVLAGRPFTSPQPADGFLGPHPMIDHLRETVGTTGRLARYGETGLLKVSLSPNLAGVYGLRDAWCYTVAPPARWMRLCERIDPAWTLNGVFVPALSSPEHLASPVLDLLGVKAVVGLGKRPAPLPDGLTMDREFGRTFVLRNAHALPRVFCVAEAEPRGARDEQAVIDRLLDEGFDPRRTAIVEGDALTGGLREDPAALPTPTIVEERPERLRIRLDGGGGAGLLVLLDSYAPGWHAAVDGASAPVLPADFAFRAVPFPAGAAEIELTYAPRAYTAGRAISFATLLALLLALLLTPLQRSPQP